MKHLRGVASLLAATACLFGYAGERSVRAAGVPVTFNRQIAPILYGNCTSCHHPGGAGPFSLLTYTDARRRAPQIEQVTKSHFMPPWLPQAGYGDFLGERHLGNEQIELIRQWVEGGMPEGDAADLPTPPMYPEGWTLGKPDLVLTVERPFAVPASGSDVFRNFILPYSLQQTHYIRALEIRPGNPQVVHHANILIDRTASFRRSHADWRDGVSGMELVVDSGSSFDPDSHFLFWKPDTPALVEPEGMPWRLDPGNDLILNMHLKPSGKTETVQAQIALYFTDAAPVKQPMLVQLEHDSALDIPPGKTDFVIEDELKLPVDVDLLGIYPHAHYLGKELEAYAILPSGKKTWLIRIPDWDIDRQSIYRYRTPVFLPKGTVVHMHFLYDNSRMNIHNPHDPPVRVRAGNRSVDEMGHTWLQLLPVNAGTPGPDPRLLLEEAWMQRRLEKDPEDPLALYNLAAAKESGGDYKQAIVLYKRDLAAHPDEIRALNGLGVALAADGNSQQARLSYQRALQIDPAQREARFNLARLDLDQDDNVQAEQGFRSLLAESAGDAAVHVGLGVALFKEHQLAQANSEFEIALKISPQDEDALQNLGEIALIEGRPNEALGYLERAVGGAPGDSQLRARLAFAYSQTGQNEKALAELTTAAGLSPGDKEIHALLSQSLASAGRLPQAIEEEQLSLRLDDHDADGWNNLGVLELRSGNESGARKDFERAIALNPNLSQARANLSRLLSHSSP